METLKQIVTEMINHNVIKSVEDFKNDFEKSRKLAQVGLKLNQEIFDAEDAAWDYVYGLNEDETEVFANNPVPNIMSSKGVNYDKHYEQELIALQAVLKGYQDLK
jgi:hypothetical protein